MRVLSLCTGIGGLEKGIELSGVKLKPVAYVEIEAMACANMVAAMEKGYMASAPIWTNLKTFDPKPFRGAVDLITAGYPCQPFSHAGRRKGEEDPRHLWPYIRKHIETVKPIYCFFENVEGHLTLGYGEVYRSLRDMGYKVEAGIFSSEETGGSHQRKRLFILAKNMGNIEYNNEGLQPETGKPIRFNETSKGMEQRRNEMANTSSGDDRRNAGAISKTQGEEQIPEQYENTKLAKSSKYLANATSKGLRKTRKESKSKEFDSRSRIPIAPPGPIQYEWEHPRKNTKDALKSALGLSVTDGYDFRPDILRALGNSVDPWTAKKAFKTLIEKI